MTNSAAFSSFSRFDPQGNLIDWDDGFLREFADAAALITQGVNARELLKNCLLPERALDLTWGANAAPPPPPLHYLNNRQSIEVAQSRSDTGNLLRLARSTGNAPRLHRDLQDKDAELLRSSVLKMSAAVLARRADEDKALRAALQYARSLLEASLDPLVAISAEGKITDANAATEELTGVAHAELIGRDFAEFFSDPQLARAIYQQAFEAGAVTNCPLLIRHVSGRETDVLYNANAYRSSDGTVLGVVATARDITERKKMERQLLQSEKLASIGQLAAGVAHEINNPIAYVKTNLGTLKEYVGQILQVLAAYDAVASAGELPAPAQARIEALKAQFDLPYIISDLPPLLADSAEGLERVRIIVQELKNFSRIETQEKPQAEDLIQGIESTLNVVWNELKYKCELHKEYSDLPAVECVLPHINQVFMNLLVNAAQAIAEQGIITIRTGCQDDEVWVEISDTGSGIPANVMPHLFDPFFTTKPVGKGTGLGLSVSYGIVLKHHGRIEVKSQPGQGSTFRVCLPIRQPLNTESKG